MVAGLVGLGFALEEGYHYMVTSLFWGLYVFGECPACVFGGSTNVFQAS